MNNKLPPLWLVVGLMMFPQIVETIYSPVLTHIASQFRVSEGQASQTLSVYFLAFAAGVVCWGRLCDLVGRRPAMLAGLMTYGAGTLLALLATQFETLLLARVIAAFGAAVGSVVTQTMLRDSYQGSDLARVFSVMGIALSLSPVLGLVSGGQLASGFGYLGYSAPCWCWPPDCCWSLAGNCRKPGRPSPSGSHSGRWHNGWRVIQPCGATRHWWRCSTPCCLATTAWLPSCLPDWG